jgi:hypothetical protein
MKKILFLLSTTILFSCTQTVNNVNSQQTEKSVVSSNQLSDVIKVSDKAGASLPVRISFPSSFKTKASSNGTPAKLWSDVKALRIFLTTSNTAPLDNIVSGSDMTFSYPTGLTGSSKVYNFANVPAGMYYTVALAYSDTDATMNIIEGGTTIPANFVSANYATISSPSMAFTFSDSASAFDVTVKLANAIGANLDSDVTVQSGVNNLSSATIGVEETNDPS